MRPSASTTRMPFGSVSMSTSRCRAKASDALVAVRNQWTRAIPTPLLMMNVASTMALSVPIAKVLYGGRKKDQAAEAESSDIRIAGPRPRKNATRRIAGRKTINPRSEILINQLSSKPRTEKLKRNAAKAMVYRHATLCVAVRSHALLDLPTDNLLALMGAMKIGRARTGTSVAERLRFRCHFPCPAMVNSYIVPAANPRSLDDRMSAT